MVVGGMRLQAAAICWVSQAWVSQATISLLTQNFPTFFFVFTPVKIKTIISSSNDSLKPFLKNKRLHILGFGYTSTLRGYEHQQKKSNYFFHSQFSLMANEWFLSIKLEIYGTQRDK